MRSGGFLPCRAAKTPSPSLTRQVTRCVAADTHQAPELARNPRVGHKEIPALTKKKTPTKPRFSCKTREFFISKFSILTYTNSGKAICFRGGRLMRPDASASSLQVKGTSQSHLGRAPGHHHLVFALRSWIISDLGLALTIFLSQRGAPNFREGWESSF